MIYIKWHLVDSLHWKRTHTNHIVHNGNHLLQYIVRHVTFVATQKTAEQKQHDSLVDSGHYLPMITKQLYWNRFNKWSQSCNCFYSIVVETPCGVFEAFKPMLRPTETHNTSVRTRPFLKYEGQHLSNYKYMTHCNKCKYYTTLLVNGMYLS